MSGYGDYDDSDEYDDEELEEIKRRKLEELRRQAEAQRRQQEEAAKREAELMAILRAILDPEALNRINNLKLVKPELADAAVQTIISLVQAGRLVPPVNDDTVKNILIQLDSRSRREYEIKFKWK
ncbi:DNA-binding protein [Acidilobus saccharovorans 345-15]|uniref:DNA-binding protein ASAC_1126 n=1 Tax=Acidilobus saccharovorans (strain DSM 16705 / JCM 18335 / VKM B-2471 / 345-15) TaxID=666510 RepID=D9Q2J3_ACIS3|nr:DNA-binding protein [Acidilobus saccharovorans]ADL19531.1 DNA-binding protein [Acidilobus saccharovorans 345-15]